MSPEVPEELSIKYDVRELLDRIDKTLVRMDTKLDGKVDFVEFVELRARVEAIETNKLSTLERQFNLTTALLEKRMDQITTVVGVVRWVGIPTLALFAASLIIGAGKTLGAW